MKFRTEIEIPKSKIQFEHSDTIMTLGSCFAENISKYFSHYKFNVLENPFGVLYNPVSIYNALSFTLEQKRFTNDDLIFDQSEYHSFYHHSDFSHHEADVCLKKINDNFETTYSFLKTCKKIIISFGTSSVFKHQHNNIIVSNCHKIPQKEFERIRLTIDEIEEYIQNIINTIKNHKLKPEIIFTVSPVRHWKDGAVDNQLSKSALLLAVNNIVNKNDNCVYFPSYEIMMDDLRDYRFYAEDLIHPNKIATDYIWEKFSGSYFSKSCLEIMNEVYKVVQALKHKPRNPNSEIHQRFLEAQAKKINEISSVNSHLDFSYEIDLINQYSK